MRFVDSLKVNARAATKCQIGTFVPPETHKRISDICAKAGISHAMFFRSAVSLALDTAEKELASE